MPEPSQTTDQRDDTRGISPAAPVVESGEPVSFGRQAKTVVRDFSNPLYHWRKIREDVSASRAALKNWHLSEISDPCTFEKAARGKLFSTFVIAGLISMIALPAGAAVQAATANAYWGLAATIVTGQTVAFLAYQAIWFSSNRDLYRTGSVFQNFRRLQHDLLPMQWEGLKIVSLFISLGLPFLAVISWLLQHFAPGAVRVVPISVIAAVLDALLFNSNFVRAMGNLFEKHARVLTRRYTESAITASP
jgi:hypothetical protein